MQVAPNVRPSIENEVLAPAQEMLAQTVTRIRNRHLGGLQAYSSITSAPPAPSSHTFGRLVRYLSQINDNQKHVLGVDLGASYTTLAAAREGKLELSVYTAGVGAGLERVLELSKLAGNYPLAADRHTGRFGARLPPSKNLVPRQRSRHSGDIGY